MYQSHLTIQETEAAIKWIKDAFEMELAKALRLVRVSAPLFVAADTGLNDRLSGYEPPLSFEYQGTIVEVVQSLAKWKRQALHEYAIPLHHGLYTDMNAIRPNEILDETHSLYVDQWDWEKSIEAKDRTQAYLQQEVRTIYQVMQTIEQRLLLRYPQLSSKLPATLTFINSETLRQTYPTLSPCEREQRVVEIYGAVFIEQIGAPLGDGIPHGPRSPDYDDWTLNGDLLVYHAPLKRVLELSSMGIRVDAEALQRQLQTREKWQMGPFHERVLAHQLPLSIGGGIGQSRMCQYLLEKQHIGEVQASYWPPAMVDQCRQQHIPLL